jgi:peptidyl-prolyl cis-trans isomerase B (cyclophilin B)
MNYKGLMVSIVLAYTGISGVAQKKDQLVTIKTKYGEMIVILYDETPKHKANFIKLASEHFYDSLLFHRIIEGFMIQGGDPDSKKAKPGQQLGLSGPGYTVDAEFNPALFHEKGALAAARMNDQANPTKASSGSQFYIVQGKVISENELKIDPDKFRAAMQKFFENPAHQSLYDSIGKLYQAGDTKGYETTVLGLRDKIEKETGLKTGQTISPEKFKAYSTVGGVPRLDGSYTVFGKVIKGIDVIDKIAVQPKDQADRPNDDIRMFITVQEMSKKKIEKLYGYKYPVVKK